MSKAINQAAKPAATRKKATSIGAEASSIRRLAEANEKTQADIQSRLSAEPDQALFRAMIDQVPDYLFVKDLQSRFVVANRAVAADLGRVPSELIGLTDFDLHNQELARGFYADEQKIISTGEALIDIDDMVVDASGKEKWFLTSKLPLRNEQGQIIGLVGVCRDVTERKLAEQQVRFLALHDPLTGLPNRSLLMDRLAQAILQAERLDGQLAVIFVDLDKFKLVNDSFGHNAGDALLKEVGQRMVNCVRAADTVARIGGDEFVLLLVDHKQNAGAVKTVVEKLRAAISAPIVIEGQSLNVSSSMGIATYPKDGSDAEALLTNADIAMHEAKDTGRDNFQFYSSKLDEVARERRILQESLRSAIGNNEISLVYQPQLDLATGRIFAVEALARWVHPTLGEVPPSKFIPLAEESSLIIQLGDWVLREACRQNKRWQDAGIAPITMCVNVSARQLRENGWAQSVADALLETKLDPKYLELELTESMLMNDVEQAVTVMQELQSIGVQFAIDDFGTGYSSLSALKNFPVARLKIDQSFIRNLPNDANERNIAIAVIALGKKLNMRVIAEGVETGEQLAFLRENHCDEMQGYHFSKPVQATSVADLLRHNALDKTEKSEDATTLQAAGPQG